jgi:hypothetical protein
VKRNHCLRLLAMSIYPHHHLVRSIFLNQIGHLSFCAKLIIDFNPLDSFQECRSQSSLECIPSSPTSKLEWVKDDTQKTTVRQTVFNIAKMCMGTGTLALPYAACQGGYIFNAAGLAIMMLWNLYSVDRLLRCLSLIPPDNNPRSVEDKENQIPDMVSLHTPTLEKVTFYAFGSWGVKIIDGISLTLYCGIITAYIGKMFILISYLYNYCTTLKWKK